jgi:hypothetical protein
MRGPGFNKNGKNNHANSTSPVSAEDLIRELINNEAVRALHREIAAKERQIDELKSRPASADVERQTLRAENKRLMDELQRIQSRLQVLPHWGVPQVKTDDNYVFVLMPYREQWSDIVWEVIKTTVTSKGFTCERADDKTGKFIMQDIWAGVNAARIVIADLTDGNPNVAYEVGMCDVLGKDQILLAQDPKNVPFDFLGIRLIKYSYVHGGIKQLKDDISARIDQIIGTSQKSKT